MLNPLNCNHAAVTTAKYEHDIQSITHVLNNSDKWRKKWSWENWFSDTKVSVALGLMRVCDTRVSSAAGMIYVGFTQVAIRNSLVTDSIYLRK